VISGGTCKESWEQQGVVGVQFIKLIIILGQEEDVLISAVMIKILMQNVLLQHQI
jgi:hypothetical protein